MAAALLLCLSEDLNNTLTRVPHTHVCLLLNSSVMHDVMIFWAKDKNLLIRSLLFEMCVKLQTADFPPQDSRREECRATRAAWLSNSTSPSLSGIRCSVPSLLSLLCASAHLWRCALDLHNTHFWKASKVHHDEAHRPGQHNAVWKRSRERKGKGARRVRAALGSSWTS